MSTFDLSPSCLVSGFPGSGGGCSVQNNGGAGAEDSIRCSQLPVMHVFDNRRVVVLSRYKRAAMIRRGGTHMLRTAASASAALRASVRFCKTSTSSPCHHDSASLIFLLNVSAAAAAMLAPNPRFHPLVLKGSQACGMSGLWNGV
jgi:hypothetical protein